MLCGAVAVLSLGERRVECNTAASSGWPTAVAGWAVRLGLAVAVLWLGFGCAVTVLWLCGGCAVTARML